MIERREKNCLVIVTGRVAAKILLNDVIMIERAGRKVRVVTKEKEYWSYEKIERIRGRLSDQFYSCLSGCIINLDHVSSMENKVICFDNGTEYYVGRDNFIRTKQYYSAYLRKWYACAEKDLQFQQK